MNRHRSIINRVLWPFELHREVVDPTGLKPAPHGLKGRRSVTRAPGQRHFRLPIADCRLPFQGEKSISVRCQSAIGNRKWAMIWLWRKDSNLRMAALTVRCLTNLATPQEMFAGAGVEPADVWLMRPIKLLGRRCSVPTVLAAATRLELVSSRLQDERSLSQLSYAAIWWTGRDSNPHKKFAGLLCCRYITSPKLWWLWVELNHQPRAYETLALFHLSYTAVNDFGSPRRS